MRYHSLIMAAAERCKCWAISYDPKVSKLMTEIDIPGWELADIPTDPQEIARAWQQQLEGGTALNNESVTTLHQKSLTHKNLLTETINNITVKLRGM
jgi:polysaccharide pyruvyl transferase WcaK-like protein